MEYIVNSLKEAIIVTMNKFDISTSDTEKIKLLIYHALEGNSKYFTHNNGARSYIENNSIIDEMLLKTNKKSDNIDLIIEDYINNVFLKQDKNIIDIINNKVDFKKLNQKLRNISNQSNDDEDFYNNAWNSLCSIFEGNDKTITKEEIRFDMIKAALEIAPISKDEAGILKEINLYSKQLSYNDAIFLVEVCIYNNNLEELIEAINKNEILSGLLLQNLLEYICSFHKQNNLIYKLDQIIDNINLPLNEKVNYLKEKYYNNDFSISKEEIILGLLKNSLGLNIYSSSKISVDEEERNLYSCNKNIEYNIILNRIATNNKIINQFLYNEEISKEEVVNIIKNMNDIDINFLLNIYVFSRSIKENRNLIDSKLKLANKRNQIALLNLLESDNLINLLKENDNKINID